MKTYIYTLSDPATGVVRYVGKTINPKKRLADHCSKRKSSRHKESWISSLRHKHQKPIMDIIDCVDFVAWEFWEIHYISLFRSWGFDLVNHDKGGRGSASLETREKLRVASTGRKQSSSAIAKTAAANRGRKNTEECKQRISEKLKGRKVPKDVLERRARAQSKPIIQFDLEGNKIKEYPSVVSAKNDISPKNNGLSDCLRGKTKTWCGYKWKYKINN